MLSPRLSYSGYHEARDYTCMISTRVAFISWNLDGQDFELYSLNQSWLKALRMSLTLMPVRCERKKPMFQPVSRPELVTLFLKKSTLEYDKETSWQMAVPEWSST